LTIAFWCVLVAAFLPYIAVGMAKWDATFDNAAPREWLERREGWRKRAYWAHQNSFEAFPPFAAAVVIAHIAGDSPVARDLFALGFVAARIAYIACYVADRPTLRSVVWALALACVVGLFVVAARG
jgi:uncharacterized MAPEG superfamily protein